MVQEGWRIEGRKQGKERKKKERGQEEGHTEIEGERRLYWFSGWKPILLDLQSWEGVYILYSKIHHCILFLYGVPSSVTQDNF